MTARTTLPASLHSFDLIRGLMALAVFLSHTAIYTGAVRAVPRVFQAAGTAVDVFMFVSGFLMLWHYEERREREPWEKPSTWLRFYTRRFFRIAPLYYLLVTAAFALQPILLPWQTEIHTAFPAFSVGVPTPHDPTVRDLTPVNYLVHYTFLFGVLPAYCANVTVQATANERE